MNIIVGKNAGFCYGVEKAVSGAYDSIKKYNEICCLGEIVHNQDVINDLETKGLRTIDSIEQAKNRALIRAHGIPKELYKKAEDLHLNLIDLTCPTVLRIHKIAEEYAHKQFFIILIGVHEHPEIIGTISFAGDNSIIIQSASEIEKAIDEIHNSKLKKIAIMAQTTFSLEKFNVIVEQIKEKMQDSITEIEIVNTICNATKIRQQETEQLSKKVDCMIIVGGKNSSNTKKLYDIAQKNCENAVLIENKDELNTDFIKQFETIGIMAGASTPQKCIKDVYDTVTIYK